MDWRQILAYGTGTLDEELLLRNEYLAAENRILRTRIKGRLALTNPKRRTLAEIGKRLDRKALAEIANIVTPETILGWYRKLIAHKYDSSKVPRRPGRPRTRAQIEALVVEMARDNRTWGHDRISEVGLSAENASKGYSRSIGESYEVFW